MTRSDAGHTCGGLLVAGQDYARCDRCGAYAYIPDGADPDANADAWTAGRDTSPWADPDEADVAVNTRQETERTLDDMEAAAAALVRAARMLLGRSVLACTADERDRAVYGRLVIASVHEVQAIVDGLADLATLVQR